MDIKGHVCKGCERTPEDLGEGGKFFYFPSLQEGLLETEGQFPHGSHLSQASGAKRLPGISPRPLVVFWIGREAIQVLVPAIPATFPCSLDQVLFFLVFHSHKIKVLG